MKLLVLFLILVLRSNCLFAQNIQQPTQSYLGLGVGITIDRVKDENFSALPQKGTILEYSLFYERYSSNIFKVDFTYGSGALLSGTTDQFESTRYLGAINITYLKRISPKNKKTDFFVGGTYSLQVIYLDWFDLDAFSYLATNGFSIAGAITRKIDETSSVETSVAIPMVQLLSRPPYAGIDETIIENQDEPVKIILDGRLSSLDQYRAIQWNVNYRKEVFQNVNLKLDYTLNLQRVDDVNLFNRQSNTFSTSLLYQF